MLRRKQEFPWFFVAGGLLVFVFFFFFVYSAIQPCIAIFPIKGEITSESTEMFGSVIQYGEPDYLKAIEEINQSPNIKAIVLYINSPGGSAVVSDVIYHKLRQLEIPIVAYIHEEGASGAYYIALAADEIVAHPYAITGSIGVVAENTEITELLKKLGVNVTILRSGEMKAKPNPFETLDNKTKKRLEEMLQNVYRGFLNVIKERRRDKLKVPVEKIADGSVFTGEEAYDLGLIDKVGYFDYAVKIAAEKAGIEPNVCELSSLPYTPKTNLFGAMALSLERFLNTISAIRP